MAELKTNTPSPWETLCETNPELAKNIHKDVMDEVRDCVEDIALEQLQAMSQEELDQYIDDAEDD